MLSKNRKKFIGLEKSVASIFSRLPLSPNAWTCLSLITAAVTAYLIVSDRILYAAIALLVTSFIDIVDGAVARATEKTTKFGAYLDTIVDRYVEGIIIVSLLSLALPPLFLPSMVWIGIYLFGSLMTTYAKAAAKENDIIRDELRGGLLERAERLIILMIGLAIGNWSLTLLVYVIAALAVLTNITALQRISCVLRIARRK